MVSLEEKVKSSKEIFPNRRARWGYHRACLRTILDEIPILAMADPYPQVESPPEPEDLKLRQYIVEKAQPTTPAALELVNRIEQSLIKKEESRWEEQ